MADQRPRATPSDVLSAALPDSEKEKTLVSRERLKWRQRHSDRGHTVKVIERPSPPYDECSCGDTYWPSTEPVVSNGLVNRGAVIDSVYWLLTDAREADAESGHDQRENWRLSHVDLVARWLGIIVSPEAGEAQGADAVPPLPDAENREILDLQLRLQRVVDGHKALQLRFTRLQEAAQQLRELILHPALGSWTYSRSKEFLALSALLAIESEPQRE